MNDNARQSPRIRANNRANAGLSPRKPFGRKTLPFGRAGLENRCGRNPTEGSNPSLSAPLLAKTGPETAINRCVTASGALRAGPISWLLPFGLILCIGAQRPTLDSYSGQTSGHSDVPLRGASHREEAPPTWVGTTPVLDTGVLWL